MFPDKPTCHGGEVWNPFSQRPEIMVWRKPQEVHMEDCAMCHTRHLPPYVIPFHTCGYCGSIHPADLMTYLDTMPIQLHWADRKYGYPHKVYIEGIPNPIAGQPAGIVHGPGPTVQLLPASPAVPAKWYSKHLLDEGWDEGKRQQLIDAISSRTGVFFVVKGDQLLYYGTGSGYPAR